METSHVSALQLARCASIVKWTSLIHLCAALLGILIEFLTLISKLSVVVLAQKLKT